MKFIYLTTNLINGKRYIGQHTTNNLQDDYLGSGTLILKAIEKYGKENFQREILCYCETQEELDQKEAEFIQFYNAIEDESFYNLREGGLGGDAWKSYRAWRERNPEQARELDKQAGERLQAWCLEHPQEWKSSIEKMLEASHAYWKAHPEEMLAHMQEVNKAKEKWQQDHPEEHQTQVNRWRQMGTEANSKRVRCITTGKEFPSVCEAGRYYKVPQPNISKVLKGERKSAGKHPQTGEKLIWEWVK